MRFDPENSFAQFPQVYAQAIDTPHASKLVFTGEGGGDKPNTKNTGRC